MALLYKDTLRGAIVRLADGAIIPKDPANADYQRALALYNADNSILDPADPLPKVYAAGQQISPAFVRTTSTTPTEIFAFTVPVATEFTGTVTVRGITDDIANLRLIRASFTVGRGLSNGAVFIPARVGGATVDVEKDRAVGTGGSWSMPTITIAGNVVSVKVIGPASPVNWLLTGSYETFVPLGI